MGQAPRVASVDLTPIAARQLADVPPRYLGIDCGGTNTKLLLAADEAGSLRRLRSAIHPTPAGPEGLPELRAITAGFLGDDAVDGLAIAVPGIVDGAGRVIASTNATWLVGSEPARAMGPVVPGATLNDGVAAAEAEALLGAGRSFTDLFVYALGTGIAGAHIVNGVIRRGAHGGAYEVGHVGTGEGRRCSCGQRGCLETVIGGSALGANWDELRGEPSGSRAIDVAQAARAGDQLALEVLDEATTALARSMLAVITVLDPQAIVIGGGVSRAADLVIAPAVAKLHRFVTFQTVPPIQTAELGVLAGAWGAVLAARAATLAG